jgi:hypothetical protein
MLASFRTNVGQRRRERGAQVALVARERSGGARCEKEVGRRLVARWGAVAALARERGAGRHSMQETRTVAAPACERGRFRQK